MKCVIVSNSMHSFTSIRVVSVIFDTFHHIEEDRSRPAAPFKDQ